MKPSLLLVSHKLDYSGAPLALLSLAKALQSLGRVVHLQAFRDGPLRQDFEALGIGVNQPVPRNTIGAVIANSVNTVEPALRSTGSDIPVIGWIHESLDFLSMLKVRPESLSLNSLAAAVFPSEDQAGEFAPFLGGTRAMTLPSLVDQPYRKQPGRWRYDFCISGAWDRRNDQRMLLHYLGRLRPGTRVALIGAGEPDGFRNNRLDVRFLGTLSPDEAKQAIAESRTLISHSMAETQNLPAMEAIMAGRPCVLSDIPAHRRIAQLTPLAVLFARDEPEALDKALHRAARMSRNQLIIEAGRRMMEKVFGWEAHLENIRSLAPRRFEDLEIGSA